MGLQCDVREMQVGHQNCGASATWQEVIQEPAEEDCQQVPGAARGA